jgi:DNA primase
MPEGEGARRYLAERGLSPEVQQAFAIGYAPAGWEALKRHLSERGVSEAVER